MNRTIAGVALAALLTLAPCLPAAAAQDLGGLARGLLKRAASGAARPAATPASEASPDIRSEQPEPAELEVADFDLNAAPHLPAPAGFIPWPANAGDPRVVRPSQFIFSPDVVALKDRYRAASTFACSTCEGSIDFDVWRRSFSHPHESYSSWSKILEAWTVGRTITWKGQAHDGTITVRGEALIGSFLCRQLRHRMTSHGPRPIMVERPGLICLGRRDQYSGAETWHEVF